MKLFEWFLNNFPKGNSGKYHFLTNNLKKVTRNIRSEKTWSSSSQKVLGADITAKLSVDDHIKDLCMKAS